MTGAFRFLLVFLFLVYLLIKNFKSFLEVFFFEVIYKLLQIFIIFLRDYYNFFKGI